METNRAGRKGSSSLGELFKHLGDATSPSADYFLELNCLRRGEQGDLAADGQFRRRDTPLVLSFEDLTYTIPSDETKTLLNRVSGRAREGEILAVMGASGSGKTTLIDAVANRIARGSLRGGVTLNGEALESRVVKSISAYVMQEDLLYPMLTVEETFVFSAEFRIPRSVPASKKRHRVNSLMKQLELEGVARCRIGDESHRGISGGERRRVSIGMDIIHDPILLFLDEPTSGLDSTSAFNVVKVLQSIAKSGSIVVTSIHQPSARILHLLDQLLFLSRGEVVYSGRPAGLQPYFSFFGNPIPENENHAEFVLDLIRELEQSPNNTTPLVEFHRSWQNNTTKHIHHNTDDGVSLKEAISASISRGKLISGGMTPDRAVRVSSPTIPKFANPIWKEVCVLSKRSFTNARRLPEVFMMRFMAVLVTGFFLASVFWQLDASPVGVQERLGFFAIAMSTTYYISADALPIFHEEKNIFVRETGYRGYRRSSYVVSNAVVALPSVAFLSFAFAVTTFFAAGLAGGARGFVFYFVTTVAAFWAGISFVTLLSAVVPPGRMGFTVVTGVFGYYLIVSGVFIARDRLPEYWMWLHYVSLITYPYQAVLRNEFEEEGRCFMRGVQLFDMSPLGRLPETTKESMLKGMGWTMGMNVTRDTCFMNGPEILRQKAVLDVGRWECIFVLVAWGFLFQACFYIILLVTTKNKRK